MEFPPSLSFLIQIEVQKKPSKPTGQGLPETQGQEEKMAKFINMAIVVAVAAAILQITDAATYTVGGFTGWTNDPTGGASLYSNWAKNFTFKVNDVLGEFLSTQPNLPFHFPIYL